MKIKKALGKIFPVFDSDERKRRVVQAVLQSEQNHNDVVNIHRLDKTNVGDFYCAPHLYFDVLKDKALDISDFRSVSKKITDNWIDKVSNNSLIIGGGGLLNLRHFDMQMKLFETLADNGKKTVLWGPGHNDVDRSLFGKPVAYNIDISKFGLAGVRDYSRKDHWVPCVSCMHPIFDAPFEEIHDVGIIFSKKTIKNKNLIDELSDFPSTSNTTNLNDMVSFIGSTHTLVTDSYHAMYWAILLGKKVVVVPTTTKFFDFKYHPVISTYDTFKDDLKKAQAYDGVLEECRTINRTFADKVFDYLNL